MTGIFYGRKSVKECFELANIISCDDSFKFFMGDGFDISEITKIEAKKLELYDFVVLDLDSFDNTEDTKISAIVSMTMLLKGKVIVSLSGENSDFLDKLLENKIFNIVCIFKDSRKEDIALEFRKAFSKEGITKFRELELKRIEEKRSIYERLANPKEIEKAETEIEEDEAVLPLKLRKSETPLTIGFSSLFKHSGSTYLALNLVSFLYAGGLSVAYVQHNSSGDIQSIAKFYGAILNRQDYYTLNGMDLYITNDYLCKDYDVVVTDYSDFEKRKDSFYNNQVKNIVASLSPKRLYLLEKLERDWSELDVNFLSYEAEEDIKKYADSKLADENLVWVKRGKSLFDHKTNRRLWLDILKEYIIETA